MKLKALGSEGRALHSSEGGIFEERKRQSGRNIRYDSRYRQHRLGRRTSLPIRELCSHHSHGTRVARLLGDRCGDHRLHS